MLLGSQRKNSGLKYSAHTLPTKQLKGQELQSSFEMVLDRVNVGDVSITCDQTPQCSKLNVTWSMYPGGKK